MMEEETQEQLNDEPGDGESGEGSEMVLATPGDRLLSYIVDALIFIGIAIVGAIIGIVIALVVAGGDEFEKIGDGDGWGVILLIVIPPLLLIVAFWIFILNMIARNGQSPGKKLLKVRIVPADGSDWGWGGTLVREILSKFVIVGLISTVVGAILGAAMGEELGGISGLIVSLALFIWIVVDEKNQTLHDKIASTYVVKVE